MVEFVLNHGRCFDDISNPSAGDDNNVYDVTLCEFLRESSKRLRVCARAQTEVSGMELLVLATCKQTTRAGEGALASREERLSRDTRDNKRLLYERGK